MIIDQDTITAQHLENLENKVLTIKAKYFENGEQGVFNRLSEIIENNKLVALTLISQLPGDKLREHDKQIADDEIETLCQAIQKSTALKKLVLSNTLATEKALKAAAWLLEQSESLLILTILDAQLTYDNTGIIDIANALKFNKTLTMLDLSACNINDEGAKALAEALKYNTSLKKLSIDRNRIGQEGMKAIADALKENDTLLWLNAEENLPASRGICEAMLANNNSLLHFGPRTFKSRSEQAQYGTKVSKSDKKVLSELNKNNELFRLKNVKGAVRSTLTSRPEFFDKQKMALFVDAQLKQNTNLITLVENYITAREHGQTFYNCKESIGKLFFLYSKDDKLAAARALKTAIMNGNLNQIDKKHLGALKNGNLRVIYDEAKKQQQARNTEYSTSSPNTSSIKSLFT